MHRGTLSRRGFLENSMGAMLAAGLPVWFARGAIAEEREKEAESHKQVGPNDTIVMGAIGVGGQGTYIMNQARKAKGVKFVAVCDVDSNRCAEAAKSVGDGCKEYKDFRELVEHKGLDAVTVGTVDHWHAPDLDRRDEGRARRLL